MGTLKETVSGRKLHVPAQANATIAFFTPSISFNRKDHIFMLYTVPIHRGNKTMRIAKGFCKYAKVKAAT